ncbi:hypothetical protein [Qipengyuania psychrotolerans]|uniref:Uncharacterized protein n=1 Tax=Qipengyuania psychrotolerans TaxID=2867238 RepID=A0ABX8ZCF8_9SPHN|nr:hypothetical protein [Qipengyuania psychrotolerans]QZD86680.1 hypothetical protein K3166_10735 [Qipengyuania psychrotolerans]
MRGRPRRYIKPRPDRQQQTYVDPNKPGSPDYAFRHQQVSREIMPGMKRIDIGAPD